MSLLGYKAWCLEYNMCSINICWGNLQTPKVLPKSLISAWNSTWYTQKKTEKNPVHTAMVLGGTVGKSPTGHPSTRCGGWLLWGTAQRMTSQRHCTGSILFSCICLLFTLGITPNPGVKLRSPIFRQTLYPLSHRRSKLVLFTTIIHIFW